MGAPAQQNSAVFYDQGQGQYYTVNPPQTNDSMGNMLYGNLLSRAMFNLTGGSSDNQNRNYLGNSLNSFANRFTPKNSIQPDGAMSGAGRFLSPSNTQGK